MSDAGAYQHWPLWVSHKVVRAAIITKVETGPDGFHIWVQPGPDTLELFEPSESMMCTHAEVGGYAVVYDDGKYRSISPRKSFAEGYRAAIEGPHRPVLMSKDNPTGWKLEQLLVQLRIELREKIARLQKNTSLVSRRVQDNNWLMMALLEYAEKHQLDTLRLLNELGPDQGPGGTPRV